MFFFLHFFVSFSSSSERKKHAPRGSSCCGFHQLPEGALGLFLFFCFVTGDDKEGLGLCCGDGRNDNDNTSSGTVAARAAGLDHGLDLDQGGPGEVRKEQRSLSLRCQLHCGESGALGPVPPDREDGREPGEAGGVPVSFFDLFFLKKKRKKTEGEKSQETEKKKKTLSFFLRHLSLSTNSIDRISGLYGLSKLQILSLGRNLLRSLAGVEVVAGTLEELWVSYNSLDKLVSFFLFFPFLLFHSLSLSLSPHDLGKTPHHLLLQAGAEKLPRLRVLLASNNKITSWAEVERLSSLPHLTHLLLAGNPLATEYRDRGAALEYRLEMLKRLPRLAKIDGLAVGAQEREAVARGGGANKSGGGASGSGGGVV